VAEMAIGGSCGARLELAALPAEATATGPARDLALAFTETPGRFICEVPAAAAERFEAFMDGLPWAWAGVVTAEPLLEIIGTGGKTSRLSTADLSQAWRRVSRTHS
jgi:phosphoribosylformylglycinamidine (FGAM) synthase-like enzyme